jgi:hypothetical protein
MASPYQEFAQKARERFLEKQKRKASGVGGYIFTLHAQYKMKQYGLSEQRVRSVIRNPKRREEGIVPKTVAVMQPVSPKKIDNKSTGIATPRSRNVAGGEVWKQEIWVMFQKIKNVNIKMKNDNVKLKNLKIPTTNHQLPTTNYRIISAWRYPGMSPKRHPIPEEILRELEERSIIEPYEDNSF